MSAALAVIDNYFKNLASFFRLSHSYFQKRNPIVNSFKNFVNTVYNLLNLSKKVKYMRYQVYMTYHKMQQMEKLINESNPYNSKGGLHFNRYR